MNAFKINGDALMTMKYSTEQIIILRMFEFKLAIQSQNALCAKSDSVQNSTEQLIIILF